MKPAFQTAFAIMAGIGVGGVLIFVTEMVNSMIFPLPPGLDVTDREALGQALADAGPEVFAGVALGWFMGPFVGTFIATRLDPTRGRIPGAVVTVFFLLGAIMTLIATPHPTWFWVVGPGALLLGGHLGYGSGSPG
jgi:hypothetical protein